MVLNRGRAERGKAQTQPSTHPHPCPCCEFRQSSCLSPKARELLLVLGQWMLRMAAESSPTHPAQLLSCSAGTGGGPDPHHSPSPKVNTEGPRRIPSPTPSVKHSLGCHLPQSVQHTTSCHLHKHLPHMLSALYTPCDSDHSRVFLDTQAIMSCHSHT